MRGKFLAIVAGVAISALMLLPETASARVGGFHGGGFRGGAVGFRGGAIGYRGAAFGYRGAAIGYRGGAVGYRGAALGWRGGAVGWQGARAGWYPGWRYWRRSYWPYYAAGAAAIGYGLAASSYPYYTDYYYGGGDDYDDGCVLQQRSVLTDWGYRRVLVRVCY